jgi:hypothetical protein
LRRAAMSGAACMPDTDRAIERLLGEPRLEIAQSALRAPSRKLSALQGSDAGGIIAAVERVHKRAGHRLTSENAHNSAHASDSFRAERD